MDPKATVQALMDALQTGDFKKAHSLVSDGFFSDNSIVSMVLTSWMGMGPTLKAAFPDLDYGLNIESVDGNIVRFSTQIQGTHSGDLDLTTLKMGVVPATNRSLATASEYGITVVRAGKVISWAMESTKCTNLITILEQLGVGPQQMQIQWD